MPGLYSGLVIPWALALSPLGIGHIDPVWHFCAIDPTTTSSSNHGATLCIGLPHLPAFFLQAGGGQRHHRGHGGVASDVMGKGWVGSIIGGAGL